MELFGKASTQGFVCSEMAVCRGGTVQGDLWGLSNCIHVMVWGKYMTTFKEKATGRVRVTLPPRRFMFYTRTSLCPISARDGAGDAMML